MSRFGAEPGGETRERLEDELAPPAMYRVLMHNDDYTSMDFVVHILETVFRKPSPEAVQLMIQIHKSGLATCGVYPAEIAEAKIASVHGQAREHGYPLRCTMEPE